MSRFLAALLSSDDRVVDIIAAGGLLCLVVLCGLTAYDAVVEHHAFGPVGFAGAAATIIGATAAARAGRDRLARTTFDKESA